MSDEWELIERLSGKRILEKDPSNAHADDEQAAALGHALFFDKRLATAIRVDVPEDEGGLGTPGETEKVACFRVIDRDELLREVWGQTHGGSNVVDAAIRSLRKKLDRYAPGIETIKGFGYAFRGFTTGST